MLPLVGAGGRCEQFEQWKLEWEPGTRFEYRATSAHWVLVDLIERLSGIDCDYRAPRDAPLGPAARNSEDQQGDVSELVQVGGTTTADVKWFGDPRNAGRHSVGAIMRAADLALFYRALLHNRAVSGMPACCTARPPAAATSPTTSCRCRCTTLGLCSGRRREASCATGASASRTRRASSDAQRAHARQVGRPRGRLVVRLLRNGIDTDVMKEARRPAAPDLAAGLTA
jgi:hypothetical protein